MLLITFCPGYSFLPINRGSLYLSGSSSEILYLWSFSLQFFLIHPSLVLIHSYLSSSLLSTHLLFLSIHISPILRSDPSISSVILFLPTFSTLFHESNPSSSPFLCKHMYIRKVCLVLSESVL